MNISFGLIIFLSRTYFLVKSLIERIANISLKKHDRAVLPTLYLDYKLALHYSESVDIERLLILNLIILLGFNCTSAISMKIDKS